MSVNNNKPLAIIVGAGEGLGISLMKQFVEHDYQVVAMNRSAVNISLQNLDMRVLDAAQLLFIQCGRRITFWMVFSYPSHQIFST